MEKTKESKPCTAFSGFLRLIKVYLLSFWGINKALHSKDSGEKKKLRRFLVLYVFVGLMMAFYIGMIAVGYIAIGLDKMLMPLMLTVTSVLSLVSGFSYGASLLFGSADYDLTMSLPIPHRAVVSAKLAVVYIYDLALVLVTFIPSAVVYAAEMGPGAYFYVSLAVGILFAPLLPITIAAFLSVFIKLAAANFRHKNVVTIIFSFVAVIAILAVVYNPSNADPEKLAELANAAGRLSSSIYPPAALFGAAVNEGNMLMLLLFALASAVPFVLLALGLSKYYARINALITSRRTRKKYSMGAQKSSGVMSALYKKELKRYLSSTIYVTNTGLSPIMLIAASVALIFVSPDMLEGYMELEGLSKLLGGLLPAFASMIVGLGCTTGSSISIEGKQLWLTLSLPVTHKMIFISKILVNLSVLLPGVVVSSVIFTFALKLSALEALAVFLIPTVYSVFISLAGIYVNCKFPNYDWTNEVTVVKQSMAMFITIMVGMLPGLAAIPLTLAFGSVVCWCLGGITLLLSVIMYIGLGRLRIPAND